MDGLDITTSGEQKKVTKKAERFIEQLRMGQKCPFVQQISMQINGCHEIGFKISRYYIKHIEKY